MEGKKLNVLVIEDNPPDFFLFKEIIYGTSLKIEKITNATNLSKAIYDLNDEQFDLVFLDLTLPDSAGLDSFLAINDAAGNIPIIVLSGMVDERLALEIVKRGAQDFLIKGNFDYSLLDKSIRYSIERKRNLDIIKQSEHQYKYLFENNPIPMWAYDLESKRFLVVNQAALHHYGYTEDEFLSMTIFDIRPSSDSEVAEKPLQNAAFGNTVTQATHIKKDGTQIFVEITGHHIIVNNRRARLNLAYDITEQRKAQQENIFHAEILKNITDIVIVTDLEGNITYWNKGASVNLEYEADEMLHKSIAALQYNKSSLRLARIVHEIDSNNSYVAHLRAVTKSGKLLWLDLKTTYLFGLNNEKTGFLWISNDITQDVLNKEKLLIQKSAIEAVGVGVVITGAKENDYSVIMSNPKFEQITGYSEEEIIGKNIRFLQGEGTNQETIKQMRAALQEQKMFDGEILNYRKNGEPFWNKVMINPIFDDEGKLINFVGFQQDITDAKNAKEDLLYKNRELNTFIYKASHDLRSPIASLIGLIKVAQLEFTNEVICNYLNMMDKTSVRLDKILRTLIDMISIKQEEPDYTTVTFATIVQKVIESKKYSDVHAMDISLDFEKDAILKTDTEILVLILENLVENALKFRDKNKCKHELKISLVQFPHKNQITISDNGLGILKEYQSKVFDMFYRANDNFPGSGLGLYIARNFVEKLQGRLSLKTEYCIGTSVLIELPVNVIVND